MDTYVGKRGRPRKSDAEQEAVRRRIVAATKLAYINHGYHGLSVELILAKCGLSRPTFYKYFRHTDEPIEIILREVNNQLINTLAEATSASPNLLTKIEAALTSLRKWGNDTGPLLAPLFSELHDIHSPASKHRLRTFDKIVNGLIDAVETEEKTKPSRLLIEAFINGVEFLAYRFQLETMRDEASWNQTYAAMLRLAQSLLKVDNDEAKRST